MAILDKDIKKLWGLAAGRCSCPGCSEDCIKFIDMADPTIIGEMAHVISKSASGPRGVPTGGEDCYENLILLCPTHHSLIDKAPENSYPADKLLRWKKEHEDRIKKSLLTMVLYDKKTLCSHIMRLLQENYEVWKKFGPESEHAQENPLSNLVAVWELRKLYKIIPNNEVILNLISAHSHLFHHDEYRECCAFVEHAKAFETNAYVRTEGVPRFPQKFKEVIEKYA